MIIFLIAGALAVSGYMYLRTKLAPDGQVQMVTGKDLPKAKAAETPLDLRPRIIARLQQLVKKGSGGLYNFAAESVDPDVLLSTITVRNVALVPDSIVMMRMRKEGRLPQNVFKIRLDSLRVNGIGVADFISKDSISLQSIFISNPHMDMYAGNADGGSSPHTNLYQQLRGEIKSLQVDRIAVQHGHLVKHRPDNGKPMVFDNVDIHLDNIRMDSTTQFDENRLLFAADGRIAVKNYAVSTNDGLYTFKVGSFALSIARKLLNASNIHLSSPYGKAEFMRRVGKMRERYDVSIDEIQLHDINWWALFNEEAISTDPVNMNHVEADIYLDRSLPPSAPLKNNFPNQLLMKLPFHVFMPRLTVNNMKVSYEEFNPHAEKSGRVFFTALNATFSNVTNMKEKIRTNRFSTVKATGRLMDRIPFRAALRFDLAQASQGTFSADIETEGFDGTLFNSVTEPLALFNIKRGKVQSTFAHVDGNENEGRGRVRFLYSDAHVTPLKKDDTKENGLKKKSLTSFIANLFVIKNANPSSGGEIRTPDAYFKRDPRGSFFNLIWKTMLVGVLKTIGAPVKLADPAY